MPPLRSRLEYDYGFLHGKWRRICRRFGATSLPENLFYFRELLEHRVAHLQNALCLRDGNTGHSGGHVENGSLIERRHELTAKLQEDWDSEHHQHEGRCQHQPLATERPSDYWFVSAHQDSTDGMMILGLNSADQQGIGKPAQPIRPEMERTHIGEEHAQRGIQ